MNISLTPELDTYVKQKVQAGMYHSASEVVREGLRLLREQDDLRRARLDQLRKDIDVGISQIESGHYTDNSPSELGNVAAEIKSRGRKLLSARKSAHT